MILSDNAYREAARAIYEEGWPLGTIDIPVGADVTADWLTEDPGCWVEARVWIADDDATRHDPTRPDVPGFLVRRAMEAGHGAR